MDEDEWTDIINECHPDFQPPEGEPAGLRNIHVFALANVLKRPIILLDSLTGLHSSADYSGKIWFMYTSSSSSLLSSSLSSAGLATQYSRL